jgi:hypothetical protein
MQPNAAARVGARITAIAGAIIGVIGLILVFGSPRPTNGVEGIGTAFQTLVGGVLLVTAALAGVASVLLWLVAERRRRRLR